MTSWHRTTHAKQQPRTPPSQSCANCLSGVCTGNAIWTGITSSRVAGQLVRPRPCHRAVSAIVPLTRAIAPRLVSPLRLAKQISIFLLAVLDCYVISIDCCIAGLIVFDILSSISAFLLFLFSFSIASTMNLVAVLYTPLLFLLAVIASASSTMASSPASPWADTPLSLIQTPQFASGKVSLSAKNLLTSPSR